MRRLMTAAVLTAVLFITLNASAQTRWTGTWAAAPQEAVKSFMPFNNDMTGRAVRQVIRVSAGGSTVRLQLSNVYGSGAVRISSAYIAHVGRNDHEILPKSAAYLTFKGKRGTEIKAGQAVFSDALRFRLQPLQKLSITINYAKAPDDPTVHMGSRTTSYILHGTATSTTDFKESFREDHWFNIAAVDVLSTSDKAVVIIGNSITDGKNSTTNRNDRWTDFMAEAMPETGVLNLGIGANCVLSKFIGTPAVKRFDRDVLSQRGIKAVIVFEGTNDLGRSRDGMVTARELIAAYRDFIRKAHRRHIRIFFCTILPFKRSPYYSNNHERGRETVNGWIRHSGEHDGCIDFDRLMCNPFNARELRPVWQSDWLHPNPAGYKEMGLYAAKRLKELL